MRRRLVPSLYALELLLTPVPFLLFALVLTAGGAGEGLTGWLFALILFGLGLRVFSDAAIAGRLRGSRLGASDYAAIVLKDVLLVAVWAVGAIKRSVCWRGNEFCIGAGSELIPVRDKASRQALEGV
jgi:hypothetical protein